MRKVVHRFFHDTANDVYIMEEIKWETCDVNDPRRAQGPDNMGMAFPISIMNPGFDISGIQHTYITEPYVYMDANGMAVKGSKVIGVSSYAQMDAYSQPLLPNYVQITMQDYNNGMSS